MSEVDQTPQMKPQDTTNFLLGGMQKQLEAIALEQAHARDTGEKFRNEVRDSIAVIAAKAAATASDVEVLKSQLGPKTPWYTIAAGIGAIAAIVLAAVAILNTVTL